MRTFSMVALLVGVAAAPLYAAPSGLQTALPELRQQAREVRRGFESIAPLAPAKKALALVPHAVEAEKLVRALAAIVPPPELAVCHADALDGARRTSASLDDMLQIYAPLAAGRDPAAFGSRITSAARHVDLGLTELESALADCATPRK